MRRVVEVVLIVVATVLVSLVVLATVLSSPALADWQHPVDAPVVDGFRPPASRFGAGNRGLEYGTVGGESVRAVDRGRVTFAGSVGGSTHVVIDHGDGLRSTYAFVTSASVVRGQNIEAGQVVAVAGPGFHLTARLGTVYVDPLLLMNGAVVVVQLVAGSLPEPAERNVGSGTPSPWAAVADAASDLTFASQIQSFAEAASAWRHSECTDDDIVLPAGPSESDGPNRVLIQVGGLGSSSEEASVGDLDAISLGYAAGDVVGFSYAGGCTPEPFGVEERGNSLAAELVTSGYEPADTHQSIEVSAGRLADLIEAAARARPEAVIDVAAHSLGGVVARRAIEILDDRSSEHLPVGVVITIGSPHRGTDLATAAAASNGSGGFESLIDPILPDGGELRASVPVLELAEAGGLHRAPPTGVPEGVRAIAVAAATDLIVPAEHAIWDGAVNVVVPTDVGDGLSVHDDLPGMWEVEREFSLALAGAPPRCVGLAAVLGSALQGRAVSAAEDAVTVAIGIGRWIF